MKTSCGILLASVVVVLLAGLPAGPVTPSNETSHDAWTEVAAPVAHATRSGARLVADDRRACKPRAPIAAELSVVKEQGDRVDFTMLIEPRQDFDSLSWYLELPRGAAVVSGTASGSAAKTAFVGTEYAASVRLPAGTVEVVLVTEGVFVPQGAVTPELVVERRHLVWGEPVAVTPIRRLENLDTRSVLEVAELPVLHRAGR